MNLDDDDESVFERALRADLPTVSEQNRMRQRILAAGVAASTALGSTSVAAAGQATFGASAVSKLSALSWPAKLGLSAALAAPVAALPLVYEYAPVPAASLVSQVRSSAATVSARAATKAALARADGLPFAAPQTPQTPPEPQPAAANVAALLPVNHLPPPVAANPSPPANSQASAAQSAVAAFDSTAQRNESTLAAETQLLDRAFAALSAGDRSTASALVAEHARLFPNGLLRHERERARARLARDSKGE